MVVAEDDREIDLFTWSVDIPLGINKCVESGGVGMSSSHFETGGVDAGGTEWQVVEIVGRACDEHGGAEAGKFFAGKGDLGDAVGVGITGAEQLVVGAIGLDGDTVEGGRCFDGIGEDEDLLIPFFCDDPDVGKRDKAAIADSIVFGATDHDVVDAFELRQLVGDIEVDNAVDVAGAASWKQTGIDLLFIDDVADGEITG